jgi:ribosome maturation factor RimP
MVKKKIEDIAAEIALPIVEKCNFELVDVEYLKEGANWYLRVFIDKEGGITIDDCQQVSEELSNELDKTDPIKQSYFLEVSSPGIDRPLKKEKDFEKFKGEQVDVKLFQPLDGRKIYEGELIGLNDNIISIKIKDSIIEFERDKVATVRRVVKF